MNTSTQNARGQWVPAIPLPLYLPLHRYRCDCKRAFWTVGGYRGHYALVHVMGMEPTP